MMCKCGHDHKALVGDLGKNEDEQGYENLMECQYCDCESFKEISLPKFPSKAQHLV